VWDFDTGKEVERSNFDPEADIIGFAENCVTIAVTKTGQVTIFYLDENGNRKPHPLSLAVPANESAISAKGMRLAIGCQDETLHIWDLRDRKEILQWQDHLGSVRAVAWSGNGTVLASAGDDSRIALWKTDTGALVAALPGTDKVETLAFSPDGTTGASGGRYSRITLWNVGKKNAAKKLEHNGSVRGLCFSPDGSLVAAAGENGVRVWKATGNLIKELARRPEQRVTKPAVPRGFDLNTLFDISLLDLRFSLDGTVLACGGTNNTVLAWDTRNWLLKYFQPADPEK
jgi:WD40 repeat protein